MRKFYKLLILSLIVSCLGSKSYAQEIFCQVSVSAPTLQSDKQVLQELQKAINEYLNFRTWTGHSFTREERIKARMNIIISERPSVDQFRGTLQLQIIRPVYNASYETKVIDLKDKDFNLKYVPFQTLEFSDNSYIDNLTSMLNYYAYMIIGFDYDTFALNGGSEHFGKAANVVSLAANSPESGWKSFDGGNKSRYWLSQNVNNVSFRKVRNAMYTYHRMGLDMMEKDIDKARVNILGALKEVQKVNIQNPGSYIIRVFLETKKEEITNIFMNALPHEKNQLVAIMENLDPAGLNDYRRVMSGGGGGSGTGGRR